MEGKKQHDLRKLPPDSATRNRIHHTLSIARGFHRSLFQRGMGSMGVLSCHDLPHRGSNGSNAVWSGGDKPRRWSGSSREGL